MNSEKIFINKVKEFGPLLISDYPLCPSDVSSNGHTRNFENNPQNSLVYVVVIVTQ